MRQIAPQMILENYTAGVFSGEFCAAGIFVDVSGFSTMTDVLMQHGQHGAEVLASIMRQIFEPLNNHILIQGGFIVGFAGDAVTALFPYDSDPQTVMRRALAAAWAIQEQMTARQSIETIYGVFPISAKVGLAQGSVIWGILRSNDQTRATYYFNGAAVNDAAFAEHQASAGEIILTQDAFEHLRAEITCEARNDYRLLSEIHANLPAPLPVSLAQPDPAVLGVFFPEILLKEKVASEFRQVVNLFIQLPDLPEAALAAFSAYLFELQMRYGGLISRIDYGDKGCNLLLFWGAPMAFENDILRALNFISELRAQGGFSFKAGMSYFVASAGFIGSDQREEYTCYGRGVNLAARLMTTAGFGQVWLDEKVATRAESHFDVTFIGEQSFKGFAQKQKVYMLGKSKEVIETLYRGEMAGRENELGQLENFVGPLWQGRFAGSLVIRGDPGVGKSRLVYEFQSSRLFMEHTALWARCQSDQILRQSFDPFRYWLRRYFGVTASQDTQQNLPAFKTKLQSLIDETRDEFIASELRRTDSFLAALIDLHWENSLYSQLDAQGRYDNTFIALAMLVKAESLRQPTILLIEDAQYLDEDTRAFLIYLNRSLAVSTEPYPLALLATARPELGPIPGQAALFEQEMTLGPISDQALARLVETSLAGSASANLLQLLKDRSDGNPFFAEQILGYLREENLLIRAEAGWDVNISAYDAALPVDIHAILVARLDQLIQQVRDVVLAASILGREFEVQILTRMIRENVGLRAALDAAENASIWSALNEIRYLFHNALLRDAAYTMQMQARREELHAIAVQALENVYAEHLEPHYAELAYHAEHARLVQKACHYLRLAGDAALEAYQNTQAVDYYSRALALTAEDEHNQRFLLLLGREKTYAYQGQKEKQQQDLETLRELAAKLAQKEKQAEVGLRTISFLVYAGNHPEALPHIKATISLAQAISKPDMAVQAYQLWSISLYRQGKLPAAIRRNKTGLRLAREIGDAKAEAKLLNTLGLVYLEQKHLDKAKDTFETSLKIASKVDLLSVKARILNNLGMLYGYYGDLNAAQRYYEQALALARQVGDRKGESIVLSNLGWIAASMGDYDRGRSYTEKTLHISRETGDRFTEAYSSINLSSQTGAWGEYEASLAYAQQGLKLARLIDDPSGEAWSLTYLGHSLFATGKLTEAAESYQAALSIRQALNQPALGTEPAAGLARVKLAQGDRAVALALILGILAHIDAGGTLEGADEPLRVYLNCYVVLRAVDHPRAGEILRSAHSALLARLANIPSETAKQTFTGNIAYNRDILAAWDENTRLSN